MQIHENTVFFNELNKRLEGSLGGSFKADITGRGAFTFRYQHVSITFTYI